MSDDAVLLAASAALLELRRTSSPEGDRFRPSRLSNAGDVKVTRNANTTFCFIVELCLHCDRLAQDNAKKAFQQFIQDRQKGQAWSSTVHRDCFRFHKLQEQFPRDAAGVCSPDCDLSTYASARKLCFQALPATSSA
jgi:hypothetical protein